MNVGRRRLVVGGCAVFVAGLSGCTGGDGVDENSDEDTATENGTLDLREANVTGVEAERVDDGYRFSVTLYHDDDGEEGYANWWQLETLDGNRLGRRDLAHSHGTREFTRSATVDVPENVDCVVVRGHDQTHGYGGRAVLFALGSGAARGVQQGSEPTTFDETDCR